MVPMTGELASASEPLLPQDVQRPSGSLSLKDRGRATAAALAPDLCIPLSPVYSSPEHSAQLFNCTCSFTIFTEIWGLVYIFVCFSLYYKELDKSSIIEYAYKRVTY